MLMSRAGKAALANQAAALGNMILGTDILELLWEGKGIMVK
jgi:hypothetical protein